MKNNLIKIISIVLALSCALGLFGAARGLSEVSECKDYWEDVKAEALDSFDMLADGVKQLKANESTYLEGVDTYESGLYDYETGMQTLEDGEAQLAEGKESYEAGLEAFTTGQAAYYAGRKQYEEGLVKLAEGKEALAIAEAELAKNTEAYKEGKAQLSEVTGIYLLVMPSYRLYLSAKSTYESALLGGDETAIALAKANMDYWYGVVSADLSGYTIEYIVTNYEEGQAKIREYEEAEAKINAAKATIAENEALLAEAKKKLDSGGATLASGQKELEVGAQTIEENEKLIEEGKKSLAEGAEQLADGQMQLAQYEDGQKQVADGCMQAIGTETYLGKNDKVLVKSIADRLGAGFSVYKLENGEVVVHNGNNFVDLDAAMKVVQAGRNFVDDTEAAVTKELTGRAIGIIISAIACVIGIVCSVIGISNGKRVPIFSMVTAVAAVAGVIATALPYGKTYPLTKIAGGNGDALLLYAMAVVALVAIALGVVASDLKQKALAAEEEEE